MITRISIRALRCTKRPGAVLLTTLFLFLSLLVASTTNARSADAGDPKKGLKIWGQCKACHMVGDGAKDRIGPSLNDVFDRPAAASEGFRYSKAMRRAGADGLVWSVDKLDLYIENPKTLVTGTRMSFRGIKNAEDRKHLLAYLRQFSASPQDIPESAPTASPRSPERNPESKPERNAENRAGDAPAVDPAVLAIKGDPDYGQYLSSECVTCHQASGEDKGIPSITGWPMEDFVVAMHAYKTKARPHPVMQMIAGRLSDEEIAGLAAFFNQVE